MNPLDRFLLPAGTPNGSGTKTSDIPAPNPTPLGSTQSLSEGEGSAGTLAPVAPARKRLYAQTTEKKLGEPPLYAFEGGKPLDVLPEVAPTPFPEGLDESKLTPSQRIAHVLPGSSRVKSSGITLSRLERDAVLAEAVRRDMTFSAYVRACLFSDMHVPTRPHDDKIERLGTVLRNKRRNQWIKQNVEAGLLPDPAAAAPQAVWGVRSPERPPIKPKK